MVAATNAGKVYEVAGETLRGPRKPGMAHGVNIESQRPHIAELERFARWFTESVILEDLQFPVTVTTDARKSFKKDVYAHFSSSRLIEKKTAKELGILGGIYGGWQTKEGTAVHEIALVAELLADDPVEIMHRMAHELVHLWMAELGEKGTAKSGRHNKLFADKAESVGLVVIESDKPSIGYGITSLSDELRHRIETEFVPVVDAFRLFKSDRLPVKKSRTSTVAFKHQTDDAQPILRVAVGKAELFATLASEIGYAQVVE